MQTRVLEHVGFVGIYLTDPAFVITFTRDSVVLGDFGFECCTERELLDFVQFRAAVLISCGRFDERLLEVTALVTGQGATWQLEYNSEKFGYTINNQN